MVPLKCLNTPDSFIERRQVCDGIYGFLAKVIQNCSTVGFRMVNFYTYYVFKSGPTSGKRKLPQYFINVF